MNWKKIFRWIKISILAYAIIGIALYQLQNLFLFHGTALPRNYKYQFSTPFREVDIPMNSTDTINLVQFFPTDSVRKGVVLYFHGNRQNINRYAKFAPSFTKNGYEIWMPDYPGFGKSIGSRSEKELYQQAMAVYKLALTKYPADSIVMYGKSFGTGIAARTTAYAKAKRLILETPYYSIPALFDSYAPIYPTTYMSHYKIPTHEFLEDVKCPVTIFHGTDDWTIPYRCAAKLKTVLKPSDEFITIAEGSHNDLERFTVYQHKLDSLLQLR